MKINEELIHNEEIFNIVFESADCLDSALEVIKEVYAVDDDPKYADNFDIAIGVVKEFFAVGSDSEYAENLMIDRDNNKIFFDDGGWPNLYLDKSSSKVIEMCKRLAVKYPDNNFYGHSYYDVADFSYPTASADYQFENGKLHIELLEARNGDGYCPECEEDLVSFEKFDPNAIYHCDDCDMDFDAYDVVGGVFPEKKIFDFQIVDGELK